MFWVISDTHFGHKNLRKYTGRPDNVDDVFIENIKNVRYQAGDVLVHLGDLCMSSLQLCVDYQARLLHSVPYTVHTVLVRGNHDPKSLTWYLRAGWDMVVDTFSVNYLGKNILFSHKPVRHGEYKFDINVHGHLHNTLSNTWEPEVFAAVTEDHILVDPEGTYAPVRLDTLLTRGRYRTTLKIVG